MGMKRKEERRNEDELERVKCDWAKRRDTQNYKRCLWRMGRRRNWRGLNVMLKVKRNDKRN